MKRKTKGINLSVEWSEAWLLCFLRAKPGSNPMENKVGRSKMKYSNRAEDQSSEKTPRPKSWTDKVWERESLLTERKRERERLEPLIQAADKAFVD